MQPFTAIGWAWGLSNDIHVRLGLGHWLVLSAVLSGAKLAYAGRRDGRRERREEHARR